MGTSAPAECSQLMVSWFYWQVSSSSKFQREFGTYKGLKESYWYRRANTSLEVFFGDAKEEAHRIGRPRQVPGGGGGGGGHIAGHEGSLR